MEIEHEVFDIEDLFLEGKDKITPIKITINNKDFRAYVEPVTYGQIKKMERTANEEEVAEYILQNHFFRNDKGDKFTVDELDLLPAGVLKAVGETIMDLSGLNITQDDIKSF